MVPSLAAVSIHSDCGVEAATMPAPANSRTRLPRSRPLRMTIAHSPSPLASHQPTMPLNRPRSCGSRSAISWRALSVEAAQRRRRMQQAGQLHHVEIRVQQLAANAGGQVPHGAGAEQRRAAGHAQAGAQWRRWRRMSSITSLCSYLSLVERIRRSPPAILLRIVLTARRARQRIGVDLAALLADQQFRAGADQHVAIGQRQEKW